MTMMIEAGMTMRTTMSSPHDQYYDEDRRRWPDFPSEEEMDEPDFKSFDEDEERDYAEEAYNRWLRDGGDT